MGRPAGWMKQLTGRGAMRSPGAPSHQNAIERKFWKEVATGVTSEKAAEAVGVSQAVGSRWFRGAPVSWLASTPHRFARRPERCRSYDARAALSERSFFVCSDDPQAEALACAHPHVHARTKAHHVAKKEGNADWISLSKDQEGRVSYGNIERGRDAMIEGTIDLLILAHSQIVGFSGSTFQRMARLLGDAAPLVPIARPAPLPYFSFTEMTQQIERQLIEPGVLLQVCQTMIQNGEAGQALDLMRMGFERMTAAQRPDIAHCLGVMLLNQNHPRQASLYFIAVLQLQTMRYSSWLHLAYAKTLLGEHDQAQQALQQAMTCRPLALIPSDEMLEKALADRYQLPVPLTNKLDNNLNQ